MPPRPLLYAPSGAEDIVGDYRSVGLVLGRQPLELLRPQLLANRLMPAATLQTYRNGRLARGWTYLPDEDRGLPLLILKEPCNGTKAASNRLKTSESAHFLADF